MINTPNNVAETKPFNSEAENFRAELAKLQESHTESYQESENDSNYEENTSSHEETEPKVEEKVQHDADEEEESNVQGMIPRGRLNKELEKRKELEKQLQAYRDERVKAEHELEMYKRAWDSAASAGKENKVEEQPFEPLDHEAHNVYMDKWKATQQELENIKTQMQHERMVNTIEMQEAKFTKDNPDFMDAYKYLIERNVEIQKHIHSSSDDAQQAALDSMKEIAIRAYNQNKNAAEIFYNMAKNFGYGNNKTTTNAGPDIEAINNNMKKSTVADVHQASVPLNTAASNYTNLNTFSKVYDGSPDSFHKILRNVKNR